MRLKILTPTGILLDAAVKKVVAEAENGYFCLLPRHVDFAAAIVPGILTYESEEDREFFFAVDEGILVKCGEEVLVSTRDAVGGTDLGELRETVHERFRTLDEQEKKSRSALAKMEADFARRFLELGKHD